MEEKQKRKTRILLAKAGLDGHDRGINVLKDFLIEQGMEVFYPGLYLKAEEMAEIAIQEGVDYLGLSVHSGAHLEYIKNVFDYLYLSGRGALNVRLLVGGVISEEDEKILKNDYKVGEVFSSGTSKARLDEVKKFFDSQESNGAENIQLIGFNLTLLSSLLYWKAGLGLLISELANGTPEASELVDILPEMKKIIMNAPIYPGRNILTLGVTGPLGVGKSSLTDKLIAEFRERNKFVGVIAVDPSDHISGGALLGRDRTQMRRHIYDAGVHIYSMASRGCHGGVAEAVPAAIQAMALAGYDVVIVETIGAGQDQVEIKNIVNKTILVLTPDVGEDQVNKSGLTQIADYYVINKSDLMDPEPLKKEIEKMLDEKAIYAGDKKRPLIFTTTANIKDALGKYHCQTLFDKMCVDYDLKEKSKKEIEKIVDELLK